MGHAIHSILGRTKYQHVAGTRCPTDFAEVPSNLMECFFNDPRILSKVCRDKSGRALSLDQASVLIQSKQLFGTFHSLQQILYATMDLEIHGEYALPIAEGKITSTKVYEKLYKTAFPMLHCPEHYAYHQRMIHIVTYGAKYYSYLVAKASASLIYQNLFSEDPFSRINGSKWAKVQSYGGEYPSEQLLKYVLGASPTVDELAARLAEKVSQNVKDI